MKLEYIATNKKGENKMTNKIFGRDWETIQAMQRGTYKNPTVNHSKLIEATEEDIELLNKLGFAELKKRELFGVIDRLKTSNKIN